MRTLLPDPPPAECEELLERRRLWGAAQLLELFGPLGREAGLTALGNFNLGERDDYRIPDAGEPST
ncbi:MAG TPA: hypothetical protein VHW26_09525 [Solirubrobacteraceae bacterium]|jgi:hypothetical protein|nr:hypothetical protein [Solirubrobacteraceae bacterium]